MIGDIVGQINLEPISFDEFRKRQSDLVLDGWLTEMTGENCQEVCQHCGGKLIDVDVILKGDTPDTPLFNYAHGFMICCNCWQVIPIQYIYQTEADPTPDLVIPPDPELFLENLLKLKPDQQVLLFDLMRIFADHKAS